jgi:hypothetical protein
MLGKTWIFAISNKKGKTEVLPFHLITYTQGFRLSRLLLLTSCFTIMSAASRPTNKLIHAISHCSSSFKVQL